MRTFILLGFCWLCVLGGHPIAFAQEPPVNMRLVGRWNQSQVPYADVWGDGNHLYGAHYIRTGLFPAQVDILDISNPANPVLATTYFIPPPGNNSGPEDIQASLGLLFTANETWAVGSDGIFIADVRNPAQPRYLGNIHVPNYHRVHTLSYDPESRFVYLANSRGPGFAVVDLRWLSASSAPFGVFSAAKWMVTGTGNSIVHEVHAQQGRLYASAWDSGVWVYDVSHVATQAPRLLGSAPGHRTHSAVPSEDGRFIVTAEERTGGGIKLYEATPNASGGLNIVLRHRYTLSTSRAICAHQVFVKGDRVYASWYQAGVQVFEIDRQNKRFVWVASFDTTALSGSDGYAGCWAVYPYLGDDRILASDIGTGYWILELQVPAVEGVIQLNDLATDPDGQTIMLRWLRPGTSEVVAQYTATLDSTSDYLVKDVKRGTYDVVIQKEGWLRKRASNLSFAYGQSTTLNATLINGDVTRDNRIDDADLLPVLFAFGQSGNLAEDVNRDGTVDDLDLLVVLFNFGSEGDV